MSFKDYLKRLGPGIGRGAPFEVPGGVELVIKSESGRIVGKDGRLAARGQAGTAS